MTPPATLSQLLLLVSEACWWCLLTWLVFFYILHRYLFSILYFYCCYCLMAHFTRALGHLIVEWFCKTRPLYYLTQAHVMDTVLNSILSFASLAQKCTHTNSRTNTHANTRIQMYRYICWQWPSLLHPPWCNSIYRCIENILLATEFINQRQPFNGIVLVN